MLWDSWECINPGLSLSDSKLDVNLISFLPWQQVEEVIVKVNQTLPFRKVIPKCMKTISNLKSQIRRAKEKDELKRGEALVHVDYSQSYNSTQQNEIQSAYFDQENFSIFTSC